MEVSDNSKQAMPVASKVALCELRALNKCNATGPYVDRVMERRQQ